MITKSNWGGAQRYVYDLATNLPKAKFDVAVIMGGAGELGEKLTGAGIRGVHIQRLERDMGVINDTFAFFELLKIFLREKPDIVHLNSSKAGGLGGLAGRIYNVFVFLLSALHASRSTLHAARIINRRTKGEMKIALTDTFRPLDLQRKYFDEIKSEIQDREGLSGDALWERVTQFIADPDGCPPHSTGGAIDCTLVQASGEETDMGTSVDALSDAANTWYPHIPSDAQRNRILLFTAMTDAGFVNLATEWWHYSYGDQYWAAYKGAPCALYGSVASLPTD